MAHLVESMAYVGDTPWHGLGNRLSAHQPLQTWLVEAGMDWHIAQSDVLFNVAPDGLHIRPHTDAKVLYRSDTLAPLSVVSNRYKRSFSRMRCWASTRIWSRQEGLSWRRRACSKADASCGLWRVPVRSRHCAVGIPLRLICCWRPAATVAAVYHGTVHLGTSGVQQHAADGNR